MSRATDHIDAALAAVDEVLTQGCQCPACGGEEDFEVETEAWSDESTITNPLDDRGTGISNAELFGDQVGPHPPPAPAQDGLIPRNNDPEPGLAPRLTRHEIEYIAEQWRDHHNLPRFDWIYSDDPYPTINLGEDQP